jgi:hypothetical protein
VVGPPLLKTGVLLAVQRTAARSADVVVFLPAIQVFPPGCMLEMEIVSRQAALPEDDWWEPHMAVHRGFRGFRGSRLPDRLLRLGVRDADTRKATTLDRRRWERHDDPPDGPVLSWWPGGSGMRGSGELGFSHFGLWLWPRPPAEDSEFAVEWPFAGIEVISAKFVVVQSGRPGWPGMLSGVGPGICGGVKRVATASRGMHRPAWWRGSRRQPGSPRSQPPRDAGPVPPAGMHSRDRRVIVPVSSWYPCG